MEPLADSSAERPQLTPEQVNQVRELFEREADELHRYAYSIGTFPGITAADLVQTTFHEVIVSWAKVCPLSPDERRRWLRGVLKHKAIDDLRRLRRVTPTPTVLDRGSPTPSAETVAELSIALANCWKAITHMPPVRQAVAFLVWSEGWRTARVAAHLNVTPTTVRSHLHEARKQLRNEVGHLVPFLDEDGDDVEREGSGS